ncbi:unnamed protein product [Closterium sp. NIES-64]|nr:unnamed protein product [Closterium sp. NIES-64]
MARGSGSQTPVIPPTHSNQVSTQGAEAPNVAAATAGPSGSTVEAAVWRAAEEAGGVDEEILASIVMPDPEIEVMREKLQAAAPTVGAQQGAPAASTAPARTIARLAPNLPRPQPVVAEYNRITGADRAALMLALCPAVWVGDLPESTEPKKAAKKKVASDMIARVSMCAAFAPVAAKVLPIPGVGSERLSEILAVRTAAAVWCFSETMPRRK